MNRVQGDSDYYVRLHMDAYAVLEDLWRYMDTFPAEDADVGDLRRLELFCLGLKEIRDAVKRF